jgi:hypothetical protein
VPAASTPAAGVDDFAGDVGSRDVWQGDAHALDPAPLPEVEMVERARAHADDGPAGRAAGSGASS